MDIHMPLMDGYESTRQIRQLSRHATTHIVGLSGTVNDSVRRSAAAAGMDGIIEKTFDGALLDSVLEKSKNSLGGKLELDLGDSEPGDQTVFDADALKSSIGDNPRLKERFVLHAIENVRGAAEELPAEAAAGKLERCRRQRKLRPGHKSRQRASRKG